MQELLVKQREFFATGITKSVEFRLQQLQKLKSAILLREKVILEALAKDLGKPHFEGYLTEIMVIEEINYALKNLKKWVKPQKVNPGIKQFPASAQIYPEPLGVILIISPWNYPFSLIISPLIGAIASGNCTILKTSENAPFISQVLLELIANTFEANYVSLIEGGIEISQELLKQKFDHIFFTGGTKIGQKVMEAAAKNLTPVTLELGGKSPCIVDTEIDITETVKRIIWGKFLNAGQTCVAPDYLLVDQSIKPELLTEIKQCINIFYGDNPASSDSYGRIINERQFDRLQGLLSCGNIIIGGEFNRQEKYISPTILDNINWDNPIMEEEIFGPILPVLTYETLEEAIALINSKPKPLALYLFSNNKEKQEKILKNTSSGGVCINDTIMHLDVIELPFGGVGDSGIGSYHGKKSFETFSHYKSVLRKAFWGELNLRYPPYKNKINLLKKMLK
jgi:acyl-CoA reductase-like NAD-dependent aldehyde dehydrogenase